MRLALLILTTILSISSYSQSDTKGYVIEIEGSKIYIDLNNHQLEIGDRLHVFRSEGYFIHPVTKDTIRREDEIVGNIEVTQVYDQFSLTRLLTGNIEDINAGMNVMSSSNIETEIEKLFRLLQEALQDTDQQPLEEEHLRIEAEEAERIRLEEEQRRRTEIMDRTRAALENAKARVTGISGGEGVAGGEGNQGVETGSVDSKIYGEGSGTGTEGISYDLAGRQARSLPKPSYDIQSEGIVVVEITVDRNGNVTNAVPGVKDSTTLEEYFLRVAREAAMSARFDHKPDAPVIQKGTITYHFIIR